MDDLISDVSQIVRNFLESFAQYGLDISIRVRNEKDSTPLQSLESTRPRAREQDSCARRDSIRSSAASESLSSPDSDHNATPGESEKSPDSNRTIIDLGQGVEVEAGERLSLFLWKASKAKEVPEGTAEFREDGNLYLEGRRVQPSRGSAIQPAMQAIQARLNHRNPKGEIISLSAWRQWHVWRDGKFVSLCELKDPKWARGRRHVTVDLNPEDLGI
jgi:hypothetical protein